MVKCALVILGLILAVLAGLLAWTAIQPPVARPTVTVNFIGYTNDGSNLRLASFVVSNASPSVVVKRRSFYRIQIALTNPSRQGDLMSAPLSGGEVLLPPGGSEKLTMPVPPNQKKWRPCLMVKPELGVSGEIKNLVSVLARNAGLQLKYRNAAYGVHSDWLSE